MRRTLYVMIQEEIFPIKTLTDIATAQEAMRAAGLDESPVYVGDPACPDRYKNGQWLYARPRGDRS